jgi:hypothetical protein
MKGPWVSIGGNALGCALFVAVTLYTTEAGSRKRALDLTMNLATSAAYIVARLAFEFAWPEEPPTPDYGWWSA